MPLLVVGMVGLIDLAQDHLFLRVVRGADFRRSLEGHVLEHMRQTGDARHLLGRAHIDVGKKGNDGRFRTLID